MKPTKPPLRGIAPSFWTRVLLCSRRRRALGFWTGLLAGADTVKHCSRRRMV